jgi:hypothetical protein
LPAFVLNPEGDEVTVVNFGFDEVTVVGDGQEAVGQLPFDGDEPTLEFRRRRNAHRTSSRPEWYVRLRIREDRIAKLWLRRLASPDVLVWWEKRKTWVPLLSVPRMRRTISVMEAREKERSKGRTDSSLPPPMPVPNPAREIELQRPSWVESWRQRVMAESRMTPAVRTLISGARSHPDPSGASNSRETRRPPSSLPPIVVDVEPPTIPQAPRVPRLAVPRSLAPDASIASSRPTERPAAAPPSSGPKLGLGYQERAVWLAAAVVLAGLVVVSRLIGPSPQREARLVDRVARVAAGVKSPASAPAPAASCAPAASSVPAASSSSASAASNASMAHRTSHAATAAQPDPSSRSSQSSSVATKRGSTSSSTPSEASGPVANPVARAVAKPRASDLGGFDPAAARRVLISAGQRAGYCGEGPVSGSVVVTFAPTGFVQSASLTSLNGDNVRVDCVLRAFRAARIMPYDGRAITVSKSFRSR